LTGEKKRGSEHAGNGGASVPIKPEARKRSMSASVIEEGEEGGDPSAISGWPDARVETLVPKASSAFNPLKRKRKRTKKLCK